MPGIASAATSVLIGYVAGGTSTLRVGSGGISFRITHRSSLRNSLERSRHLSGPYRSRRRPRSRYRWTDCGALRRGLNGTEDDFPGQVAELLAYLAPAGPGQKLKAVPGAGTQVPVWLLGSSTYSAQLAATLGLPFAFASHFAPELLLPGNRDLSFSIQIIAVLRKPYVIAGVPIVAAETDAEANHLATSSSLRFLKLVRSEPIFLPPPVPSMDGLWSDTEKQIVGRS